MLRSASAKSRILTVIGLDGAALLIVSLFLDWYSLSVAGGLGEEQINLGGWGALEFGDALFVLIGIAAVGALLTPRRMLAFLGLGVLALAFVATAAATNVPIVEATLAGGPASIETSLEVGVLVAAGGALLLLIAGGLGLATDGEESAVGSGQEEPTAG